MRASARARARACHWQCAPQTSQPPRPLAFVPGVMSSSEGASASPAADGSLCGYAGVEAILEKFVPPAERAEVVRVLYGANRGKAVQAMELDEQVKAAAKAGDFDVLAYKFDAAPEQKRAPRVTRIAMIQNACTHPTTAPYLEQQRGIMRRVAEMLDAAGAAGVNVVCLQEAWNMVRASARTRRARQRRRPRPARCARERPPRARAAWSARR